jgi:hypothetical protein
MPEPLNNHWDDGPGRACLWPHGLPLPGHRTMGEVLRQERKAAIEGGAAAFERAKKEPVNDPA